MDYRKLISLLFVLLLVFVVGVSAYAETLEYEVAITSETGRAVPVEFSLNELKQVYGLNFAVNWDSLRVLDPDGNEVPYQIDDIDLNNTFSGDDVLVFTGQTSGAYTITVSDDAFAEKPVYSNIAFELKDAEEEGWNVILTDNDIAYYISPVGIIDITAYQDYEKELAREIGIARVAGFANSTWWADKNLGPHAEMTSPGFRVEEMEILEDSAVRLTIVARLASDIFPGLEQNLVSSIYPTGEINVNNSFKFRGYSDLTKLQSQMTHIMEQEEDSIHLLPLFRKLGWADAQEYTPADYWQEREALLSIDESDYISIPAGDNKKPLFWGATYIFASIERWRANYSPAAEAGIAEIVVNLPEIAEDQQEFLEGPSWVLESGEFRTGQFQWIAGEFQAFPGTENVETKIEETVLHYIPGDKVNYQFYYVPFKSESVEAVVEFLEARSSELTGVVK